MKTAVIAAICLLAVSSAFAATIHVPADRLTIQAGINAASNGDTVLLDAGTYYEHVRVSKSIAIRSVSGASATVIDGQNPAADTCASVFTIIDAGTVVIDGLTIRGGRGLMHSDSTHARGGGIYLSRTSLLLTYCTIRNNFVGESYGSQWGWGGGGIFADSQSSLSAQDSRFINCGVGYASQLGAVPEDSCVAGGAILAFCKQTTLRGCEIDSCSIQTDVASAKGGGVALMQGQNQVIGCVFRHNNLSPGTTPGALPISGGAAYISGNSNLIDSCEFRYDWISGGMCPFTFQSFYGGAVCLLGDSNVFRNSGILGCSNGGYAQGMASLRSPSSVQAWAAYAVYGGALSSSGSELDLENCRFDSCNTSSQAGGMTGGSATACGGALCLSGSGRISGCDISFNSCATGSWGYQGATSISQGGGASIGGNFALSGLTLYGNSCFSQASAQMGSSATSQGGGLVLSGQAVLSGVLVAGCSVSGSSYNGTPMLQGAGVSSSNPIAVSNCDIWSNQPTNTFGFSWNPGLAGNFEADPLFCSSAQGILTLRGNSQCLPSNNDGVQIGAYGQGCRPSTPTTLDVPVEFTTIQMAVDSCISGDTILLGDGVFRGAGNRDIQIIDKSLTILSRNGPNATTIDAEGSNYPNNHYAFVVSLSPPLKVIIRGITFRHGTSDGAGYGGALRLNGNAEVRNCNFDDNGPTLDGAALDLGGGTSTARLIDSCRFTRNKTGGTSGTLHSYGPVSISNCVFELNIGAGAVLEGQAAITNSQFLSNSSDGWSGAYVSNGSTMTSCEFSNNLSTQTQYFGATLFVPEGHVDVTNSTFSNNTVSNGGGSGVTCLGCMSSNHSDTLFFKLRHSLPHGNGFPILGSSSVDGLPFRSFSLL